MAEYTVRMLYRVYEARSEDQARENLRRHPWEYRPTITAWRSGPDPEPDATAVAELGGTTALPRTHFVVTRYYRVSATSAVEAEANVKREPDVYFVSEHINWVGPA
jgi:hypothetical protein